MAIKIPKNTISREEFLKLTQETTDAIQQQRSAAQIAAETLSAGRAAFSDADGSRDERLAKTRNSVIKFGQTYLPHYFENEGAPFHDALDKLLTGDYTDEDLEIWADEFGIEAFRGDVALQLLAICLPRGHGKSVIAILCDFLRRICHGLDAYMIIGSDTLDQAASQLEDIKDELEFNEKIKADFGSLKPDKGLWRSAEIQLNKDGKIVWREGRIITTNQIRIDAIGRGGKMRGRRFRQQRPTYIVLDDLDNDENVVTKEQRDKAWNWVISAVEPARDPTRGRVVVIGTVLHFDCVVARAIRKTDDDGLRLFTSIRFAALRQDPDTNEWKSNWEARFPVETLMRKKSLLGPMKFGAEYMNNPLDEDSTLFQCKHFSFYQPLELENKQLIRVLYVDPSKGKKGKGRKKSDYSGFADVLVDTQNRVTYLLNAFRKRLTPNAAKVEVVNWFAEALKDKWACEFWIEENSFGDILGENFQDELRRRGIDLKVNTLLHTTEKSARIERLSIRVDSNGFRFPNRWESEARQPEWFNELLEYPFSTFDDVADALESADFIGTDLIHGKIEYKSSGQKTGSSKMGAY